MNNGLNPIVDLPYPKIDIKKKDINLAYKLFEVYAGSISEYTVIGQYSFQSIYLDEYKDLSKILRTIAITEMRHLRMIGELINALGLIPYFVNYVEKKPIPWNSDYIDFTINYRDMLINDIKKENVTIRHYQELINYTDIQNVKDILNRIILDEKRHIEVLTKLLKQYDEDQ